MILELHTRKYYSGTPLNDHPWTTATCDITAKSSGPDWTYIDFHSNQTPEERPPRYSVKRPAVHSPTDLSRYKKKKQI